MANESTQGWMLATAPLPNVCASKSRFFKLLSHWQVTFHVSGLDILYSEEKDWEWHKMQQYSLHVIKICYKDLGIVLVAQWHVYSMYLEIT